MILVALLLAQIFPAGTPPIGSDWFLNDFGGVWTCGNAGYHERWDIHTLAGHRQIAEVIYGDPNKPDGYAFVYFVPSVHQYRYDDFHADGAQSHLTATVPLVKPGIPIKWDWTGTYYPMNQPVDPNPDITWERASQSTIERVFRKRVNGAPVEQGRDTCTKG